MEWTRNIGGKLLRCGYTTGACAAAAAKAATLMMLAGNGLSSVEIDTPRGMRLTLDVLDIDIGADATRCAIKKNAGDDPDITDGILVYAEAREVPKGISIDGGIGVGRVTKPGLDQPVGAAAINSTPRLMIERCVKEACAAQGYAGGISIILSIPEGEALAKRTFNPRMGIEGGLSIIGTTGIVEPMSNKALVDTIRLELRQLAASGAHSVLLTPGNYGERFAAEKLDLSLKQHVTCSNFIGDAIDAAVENGFDEILLVGHIGKLVKLGIGATNTHSSNGDGRMETLMACALSAGAEMPLLKSIMACVATDAALALLYDAGILDGTMGVLSTRIMDCLERRVPEAVKIGFVCFTNAEPLAGVLMQSGNANDLMELWRMD